jgi:integrase
MELDVLPVIGSLRMREVRASHLQELLNTYAGGKAGTVKKVKIALKQLFEDAEIEGIIERNPAYRLELPGITETKRRPLTDLEWRAVLEAAQTHKYGPYILTMLLCGLRRGECVALNVSDADLERKRLLVNKSLNLWRNVGFIKGTKSSAGVREVPIPDILRPLLSQACSGKNPDDILFPKSDGHYATGQTCRWWWTSFKRRCHLTAGAKLYRNKIVESPFSNDITPHFLRHTYATDLYAAGVDETAQKSFLGHASGDVTDIYRKMNDESFDRAAKLINAYFSKKCAKNVPVIN